MPEFKGKSGGGPFKMKYKKSAFPFYNKPSAVKAIDVETIVGAAAAAEERPTEGLEDIGKGIKQGLEAVAGKETVDEETVDEETANQRAKRKEKQKAFWSNIFKPKE
jgi:hypothetical protein